MTEGARETSRQRGAGRQTTRRTSPARVADHVIRSKEHVHIMLYVCRYVGCLIKLFCIDLKHFKKSYLRTHLVLQEPYAVRGGSKNTSTPTKNWVKDRLYNVYIIIHIYTSTIQ